MTKEKFAYLRSLGYEFGPAYDAMAERMEKATAQFQKKDLVLKYIHSTLRDGTLYHNFQAMAKNLETGDAIIYLEDDTPLQNKRVLMSHLVISKNGPTQIEMKDTDYFKYYLKISQPETTKYRGASFVATSMLPRKHFQSTSSNYQAATNMATQFIFSAAIIPYRRTLGRPSAKKQVSILRCSV